MDSSEHVNNIGNEPKINASCSQFDPIAALHAPYIPGLEKVDPLSSLDQFEDYQKDPELFLRKQRQKKEMDRLKRAAKLKAKEDTVLTQSQAKKPLIVKNVLTRMQRIEGPSALLHKWVQSRTKVTVVTRSFKSIRGTCNGFLVAFDRYLNLAMVDVDETYTSLWKDEEMKEPRKRSRRALKPYVKYVPPNDTPPTYTPPSSSTSFTYTPPSNGTSSTATPPSSITSSTTTPPSSSTSSTETPSSNITSSTETRPSNIASSTDTLPSIIAPSADAIPSSITSLSETGLSNTISYTKTLLSNNPSLTDTVHSDGMLPTSDVPSPNTGSPFMHTNDKCSPKKTLETKLIATVGSLQLGPFRNTKHRHMRQLLLRGDNVVSISSCL